MITKNYVIFNLKMPDNEACLIDYYDLDLSSFEMFCSKHLLGC